MASREGEAKRKSFKSEKYIPNALVRVVSGEELYTADIELAGMRLSLSKSSQKAHLIFRRLLCYVLLYRTKSNVLHFTCMFNSFYSTKPLSRS